MKIRKPKKDDVKDIAELDKQFWEIHANIDPFIEPAKRLIWKTHLKNARDTITKKNEFVFVAEKDGKVIGSTTFKIDKQDKFFKLKKYGYLDAIVVHKDYRKMGVGKMLINFTLDFLKKKGIKYVKFHTNWDNKMALNVFRKMGFKEKNIMFYKRLR